jgi:hypothetical protein
LNKIAKQAAMNYTLSRPSFNMFADVLGKERAEAFVSEFEQTINNQRAELAQQLLLDQTQLKAVVKEELRNELVTRDIFEARFKVVDERFNVVDERFKRQDFKLNVLIALAFVALTFANPNFVELVRHVVK